MLNTDRLRAILRKENLSQADLARMLDVSSAAVHQILSGKTRNSRLIPKIAKLFNVTDEYLEGTSDSPFRPTSGTMTPQELADELKLRLRGGFVGTEDAMGYAELNAVFDPFWIKERIAVFDKDAVKKFPDESGPPVGTLVAGTDAMAPTIRPGDEVVYSLATRRVNVPDAIWALDYGGLRMIRRLMPLPGGASYRISADNPASPTFEAPAGDVEVLGRAFWIGRSLT